MIYVLRTIVSFFWGKELLINVPQACRQALVTTIVLEAVASVSSKDSSQPVNECIFESIHSIWNLECIYPENTIRIAVNFSKADC